ncbi:MAG TPA: RIP metalloprotease RseP [Alphaproteobacteria bacterium]|nr:RIP metalloprotease RseP [Alphaproteobacteria bacterium]
MDILNFIWTNGASFLFILTVIVFIHELGHFLVAKYNGVRVEVFSVGFGPELFGWNDRSGTRWKLSLLPLGGYVKMFGESASARAPDAPEMSAEDKAVSFHHKRVGQRAAIVAAGPIANFLLAILIMAAMFATVGQPFTPTDIGAVQPGSAAERAGLRAGDVIRSVDGTATERFEDVQRIVRMNPDVPLQMSVERDGRPLTLTATPQRSELTDRFGNSEKIGLLGVSRAGSAYARHDPATAVWRATQETFRLSLFTLQAVGQIISGARSAEDLGGPIRIAQMSGQVAEGHIADVFWFLAMLSINLGLINLFPVPMLDGGHLMFYGVEALRGRPLSERVVEYGFRVGLGLVLTLFVFVTYQDLMRFQGVVAFFKGLMT